MITNDSPTNLASRQVVVVGSLNTDLTVRTERFPGPGETLFGSELVTAPGGKSSNQAVAAATLGSSVRLIGAVGADSNGGFLLQRAKKAGVDVSGVRELTENATGSAMIVVDASGENTIIISPGANGTLTAKSITPESIEGAAVLCLCLEVPLEAVQAAAEAGHRAGAQVLLNLSPFADVPDGLLAVTDVLLVNRTEAELILDSQDIDQDWAGALDGFVQHGIKRAIVTLGADGSVVLDQTAPESERVTPIAAIKVDAVDTTGAGDAFTGAVAHQLAAGSTLVEAAQFAARASALAATAAGAQSSYTAFAHLSS